MSVADLEQQVRARLSGGRLTLEMVPSGWSCEWRRVCAAGVESDPRTVYGVAIFACFERVLAHEDEEDRADGSTATSCGVCS